MFLFKLLSEILSILFLICWIFSIIFICISHPLSFGFVLLIQTVIIALSIGFFSVRYWYSYILFLIIVGGILVLFIYITRIASNEKFKFSKKIIVLVNLTTIILFLIIKNTDNLIINIIIKNSNLTTQTINNIENLSIRKYLNYPNALVFLLIITYLLITLIAIVKITITETQSPLRQKY